MAFPTSRLRRVAGRFAERFWAVLVVGLLLALPLIAVAKFLYKNDEWAPVGDLALLEVRVRDVGTAHTPLLGLPGRFGRSEMGHHPGPLSFYVLAPIYRLLGGHAWSLRISMALLNVLAVVCSLLIARRRAGPAGVLAAGVGIALLELHYGLLILTEPWGPHLPLLWFGVFLLAVWSVACGDSWMLPIAAASGSFCAQTHITYLAVCGAVGLWAVFLVARAWWRRGAFQTDHARSLLTASAVVLVLWAPALIDEWTRQPGNISILVDYFANPPLESVGFRRAARLVLEHLDASYLVLDSFREPGLVQSFAQPTEPQAVRGALGVGVWLATAAFAVKLGNRSLLALHGVVAVSLAVALIAISRITGVPWPYLRFGFWGMGAMLLLASAATPAVFAQKIGVWDARERLLGVALCIAMIGAYSVRLAKRAHQAGSMVPSYAMQLTVLVRGTVYAIEQSVGAASGYEGRYLVTWADVAGTGVEALGMVNELERRGFQVGVPAELGWAMREHRVMDPEHATARVHVATGAHLYDAQRIPGAVAVVFADALTAEQRREYDGLRDGVAAALRQLGHADAAERFKYDVGAALIPGLPTIYYLALLKMGELGPQAGVFIAPIRAP